MNWEITEDKLERPVKRGSSVSTGLSGSVSFMYFSVLKTLC